jgi:hypothetical protein
MCGHHGVGLEHCVNVEEEERWEGEKEATRGDEGADFAVGGQLVGQGICENVDDKKRGDVWRVAKPGEASWATNAKKNANVNSEPHC